MKHVRSALLALVLVLPWLAHADSTTQPTPQQQELHRIMHALGPELHGLLHAHSTAAQNAATVSVDTARTFYSEADQKQITLHITGSLQATPGSSSTAGRTVSGSISVNSSVNGTDTFNVSNLQGSSTEHCFLPVGGTVNHSGPNGEEHTVVFGPTCGSATVDGTAVTMPTHPFHPQGD